MEQRIRSIVRNFEKNCFNRSQEYYWQHLEENIFAYTEEECLKKFEIFLDNILLSKTSISKIFWRMLPEISKERLYRTTEEKTDKYAYCLSFRLAIESFNKKFKKKVYLPENQKKNLYGELPIPPKEFQKKGGK